MEIRTDLALERREMRGCGEIEGVKADEYMTGTVKTTVIEILNKKGEEALSKPCGTYITVECDGFPDISSMSGDAAEALCNALEGLIPVKGDVLVVGLGNPDITPDALGPRFASSVIATRHITEEMKKEYSLPDLRCVSVIAPSVTGKTGLEATEIITGLVSRIKPSVVIVVDALAARSVSRLANTVQICNTGIEPGAGVGNSRKRLSSSQLGVPVIAIGVPTVVDALSIAQDIIGEKDIPEDIQKKFTAMTVTPKDTDIITTRAAKLLALVVNSVLQPCLDREEIISLM